MITETGLAALWFAAALALLQLLLGVGYWRGLISGIAVRPIAAAQGLRPAVSECDRFILTPTCRSHGRANSHSAKTWIYKFAGDGQNEGSMLSGRVLAWPGRIALFGKRLSEPMLLRRSERSRPRVSL